MHVGELRGKRGIAYVTVYMCVYVGQPLIVSDSRNHPLLNCDAALVD